MFTGRRYVCFNTQPPEGGCIGTHPFFRDEAVSTHSRLKAAERSLIRASTFSRFNTQPPEGGWQFDGMEFTSDAVSTHSRLKAAGRDR